MDIFKLNRKLTRARQWYPITSTEQALFHELIQTCNQTGWLEFFHCSNAQLCSHLLISEKTLIRARNTLIRIGLIRYKSGKSIRQPGQYSLNCELIPPQTHSDEPATSQTAVATTVTENRETEQTMGETTCHTTVQTTGINTDNIKTKTKTNNIYKENFENYKIFEEFYELYPGNKRSAKTEWDYFCRLYNKKPEILPLLTPAIRFFIEWRHERLHLGIFTPEYPHLGKWIKERRWETQYEDHNVYW